MSANIWLEPSPGKHVLTTVHVVQPVPKPLLGFSQRLEVPTAFVDVSHPHCPLGWNSMFAATDSQNVVPPVPPLNVTPFPGRLMTNDPALSVPCRVLYATFTFAGS